MYLKYPITTPSVNTTHVGSDWYNMQLQYLTMYLKYPQNRDLYGQ